MMLDPGETRRPPSRQAAQRETQRPPSREGDKGPRESLSEAASRPLAARFRPSIPRGALAAWRLSASLVVTFLISVPARGQTSPLPSLAPSADSHDAPRPPE